MNASQPEPGARPAVPADPTVFPSYRLAGTHRQIGRQFGEATAHLIRHHLDRALARLEAHSTLTRADALTAAMQYRPYVQAYAPFLDEEVVGVAEGAGLRLEEAYLLQLRAEAAAPTTAPPAALPAGVSAPASGGTSATTPGLLRRLSADDDAGDECTSVAVLPEATADGDALIAHNADLPAFYREVGVVLEIVPDDAPPVLMLTPAGQVSYIGMNDRGLAVVANYLTCDGWRLGFPRYFLSRVALIRQCVDDAISAIRAIPRASSRNLLLLDAQGAADLETTPTRDARLDPENGILAHANHYVAPTLRAEERAGDYVHNSQTRMGRIRQLAVERRGRLDVAGAQELLQDRTCYPDTLCREPADSPDRDVMTFASLVAVPARRELWVAVGPPNQHAYQQHTFTSH